jgi:hypothetical protein
MSFLFIDVTSTSPDSGHYKVSWKGTNLGFVIKNGETWLAIRPGSDKHEGTTFLEKLDAAKHLAEVSGISF